MWGGVEGRGNSYLIDPFSTRQQIREHGDLFMCLVKGESARWMGTRFQSFMGVLHTSMKHNRVITMILHVA